ncbi:MucBP domain-containing protein [Listeria welshimeri]|uniref:MucBP domain-containing protein n=1 Tax=Listeria welshimeri TaxID=1643 RepID=UPI0018877E5A|nr:MucBP domain-containing protein [Listeria welshimeri]MBF2703843.1 MucBP domain-containing protein [Listeria welshimeri]
MKQHRRSIFILIIFMSIISLTFNPFSAKAAPLMLNIPAPQVDPLYIGDDYITGKLQQEVPMQYPGNAAYVLLNNKQYYISDYTVENAKSFRLKLPKTLEPGDTLNYFTITGNVIDPVAYPGQVSYKLAGPFTAIEKARVQINFVDEAGQTLAPSDTMSGKLGEEYKTLPKTIDGFQVKETPTNATGTYTTNTNITQVNYVYEKTLVDGENVSIQYVDEETNEAIAPEEILSGKIGASYQAEIKTMDGYELSQIPPNQTGTYTNQPQLVVFKYKKMTTPLETAKDVTVTYEDTNGNQLADQINLTGEIGATFETEEKSFEGYSLTKIPTNRSGLFTTESQEVAYIYSKDNDSEIVVPTNPTKPITATILRKGISTTNEPTKIVKPIVETVTQSLSNSFDKPVKNIIQPANTYELPKTGDTTNILSSIIGFGLLIGAIYIFTTRKSTK